MAALSRLKVRQMKALRKRREQLALAFLSRDDVLMRIYNAHINRRLLEALNVPAEVLTVK